MSRVLLLLAALVLLLWLWAPWHRDAQREAGETAAPPAPDTQAELRGAAGPAPSTSPGGRQAEAASAAKDAPTLAAQGDPGRRVVIELEGWDDRLPGDVEVILSIGGPDGDGTTVFQHGARGPHIAFRVPPRWMRDAAAHPVGARIEHPAYHAAVLALGVPEQSEGDLGGTVRLARAHALALPVRDGAGRDLRGVTLCLVDLDAQGAPARPTRRAVGGTFLGPPVPGELAPVDWTRAPMRDGRYVLRARGAGRYGLIAVRQGFHPAFRVVEIAAEPATRDVEPLVLQPAQVLRGVLRVGGEPVPELTLEILPPGDGERFSIHGWNLLWLDGRLELGIQRCSTEADGRFMFESLWPGPWTVEVIDHASFAWRQRHQTQRVVPTVYEDIEHRVAAGDQDVALELPAAWVEVTARVGDGAAAIPELHVAPLPPDLPAAETTPAALHDRRPRAEGWVVDDPPVRVAVPPDTPLVVTALADGLRPALVHVDPLPAGATRKVELRLENDDSLGRLELEARAADGGRVEAISVAWEIVTDNLLESSWSSIDEIEHHAYGTVLEPGRYRVTVGGAGAGTSAYLLPVERTVEVVAGKATTAVFELPRGGLLRLTAKNEIEAVLPASVRLLDARGVEHPRRWQHQGVRSFMRNDTRLGKDAASTTTAALAPGTWTVELSMKGYADARASVVIEQGKTSSLEVTMRAP